MASKVLNFMASKVQRPASIAFREPRLASSCAFHRPHTLPSSHGEIHLERHAQRLQREKHLAHGFEIAVGGRMHRQAHFGVLTKHTDVQLRKMFHFPGELRALGQLPRRHEQRQIQKTHVHLAKHAVGGMCGHHPILGLKQVELQHQRGISPSRCPFHLKRQPEWQILSMDRVTKQKPSTQTNDQEKPSGTLPQVTSRPSVPCPTQCRAVLPIESSTPQAPMPLDALRTQRLAGCPTTAPRLGGWTA